MFDTSCHRFSIAKSHSEFNNSALKLKNEILQGSAEGDLGQGVNTAVLCVPWIYSAIC